jgi:two-component system NarL family response regulator
MNIRVLLADDHRLVREAVRSTLERCTGIAVVGEAGSGAETLERVRALDPDVVVLDIGLPDINGIEIAARLARDFPETRIIALSAFVERRIVAEALRAGVSGYVAKASAGEELERAIRALAAGQSYFSPEVAAILAAEVSGAVDSGRLARREREVLRLIAMGKRGPEIADLQHISPATVEVHRRNIARKLGLKTVAEMTRYAVREGIAAP